MWSLKKTIPNCAGNAMQSMVSIGMRMGNTRYWLLHLRTEGFTNGPYA